jgi:hypothetical protein
MFQIPEFPSFDFSALDLDAVRNSPIGKRIAAIDFPKIDLPAFDLPKIDADKVTAVIRDAAYLTVGLGVAAVQQVRGLIRTAA